MCTLKNTGNLSLIWGNRILSNTNKSETLMHVFALFLESSQLVTFMTTSKGWTYVCVFIEVCKIKIALFSV